MHYGLAGQLASSLRQLVIEKTRREAPRSSVPKIPQRSIYFCQQIVSHGIPLPLMSSRLSSRSDNTAWISDYYAVIGNILRNDTTRANDRPLPNRHAFVDADMRADPNIVPDHNRSAYEALLVDENLRVLESMIRRIDDRMGCDANVPPDAHASKAVDDNALVKTAVLTDFDAPWEPDMNALRDALRTDFRGERPETSEAQPLRERERIVLHKPVNQQIKAVQKQVPDAPHFSISYSKSFLHVQDG